MKTTPEKKSQTRLIVALSLFALSIFASFLISYTSHMGEKYWVLNRSVAQGNQIESKDLTLITADIASVRDSYLSSNDSPDGSFALRNLRAGELIAKEEISIEPPEYINSTISLSLRIADLPSGVKAGDLVDLYQVHDARNGEAVQSPTTVVSGAYLSALTRKSANFGSDIAATFLVRDSHILNLLTASASGRIVVVAHHG